MGDPALYSQAFKKAYTPFIRKFMNLDIADMRVFALCLGIGIYGALGAPTPTVFGWTEAVVGVCLVVAVGVPDFRKFDRTGAVLLIYGLSVPVLTGLMHGVEAVLGVRDIVPFLFMMLPVLAGDLFARKPGAFKPLIILTVWVGFALSMRALEIVGREEPLSYLANMPTVLMAAILCIGMALRQFVERFSIKALPFTVMLLAIGCVCLAAMAGVVQRASLGAFIFCFVFFLGVAFVRYPGRGFVLLLLLGMGLVPFGGFLFEIYARLLEKTDIVGASMRIEELQAVWAAVSVDPFSLLFGLGWGAHFSSPAVADIEVSFTHSLLSAMLLKAGLCGLILSAFYVFALLRRLVLARAGFVLTLAVAVPVLIDVFLYASYKSLDFGLVLLLIVAFECYGRSYARQRRDESGQNIEASSHLR